MSLPQNGRAMDQPDAPGGSVGRARERMEAGVVREDQRGTSAARSRPQALQGRMGPIGASISRPTQIPQWPLPGPIQPSASTSDPDSSRPSAARSQPPQRPPRPSHVPSILDGSRIQDPTPVFQYQPQNVRDSDQEFNSSVPQTPSSLQTASTSTASISDFPIPAGASAPAMPPARRSVTLGPPPSSRRGASSFYSNVSYVSPIPEESPRTRSHTSFASSAAMPESWGTVSPGNSPVYPDATYGNMAGTNADELVADGDGNKVVRSASLGKRGKPHIVMNKGAPSAARRSDQTSGHENPFADGTGLADASSSSESLRTGPTPPTAAASYGDPMQLRKSMTDPAGMSYNRLSAIRRPPRLDMEAVEKSRARGSMTSLPDLIRRATRLAAMMDGGKRPGSRFDDFDFPDEKMGAAYSDRFSGAEDRHQSGLSDMLAAFPPPAHATSRASRVGSWFKNTASWPLPPGHQENGDHGEGSGSRGRDPEGGKGRRKYCGLPLWGLILIILVVVAIIAAAIFVPLQFFVFNNDEGGPFEDSALEQCRNQITCENGGTNVVTRDVCSCICTNGFTGSNCTDEGTSGCTTTRLVNLDENPDIDDVTLGQAIPRLITDAEANFSVPLSGTTILARFNMGSLSCTAQNSLVTFDGRAGRMDNSNAAQAARQEGALQAAAAVQVPFVSISVITVIPFRTRTASTYNFRTIPPHDVEVVTSGTTTTTVTTTPAASPDLPAAAPSPTNYQQNTPTGSFSTNEEVLDFARVAVLFILQEDGVAEASRAQSVLQRFFTQSDKNSRPSAEQASNVDLGNGNAIDLVNFRIDAGTGVMGEGNNAKRGLDEGELFRRGCRQFEEYS